MSLLETTILIVIVVIGFAGLVAAARALPRLIAWLRAALPTSAGPTAPAQRPTVCAPEAPDHLPPNSGPDASGPDSGRRAS
jgi:hypothetical protein